MNFDAEKKNLNYMKFDLVIGFGFYDGPENGIAVYKSGRAIRFVSLGDSKYNCFRCFDLIEMPGSWWRRLSEIDEISKILDAKQRVFIPSSSSDYLADIEAEVASFSSSEHQIGIGSPYLEWLRLAPISTIQINEAKKIPNAIERYRFFHKLVKLYNPQKKAENRF